MLLLEIFVVPLEGLKSQAAFEDMRQSYIRELTRAIHIKEKGMVASSQRFYRLTKLMDLMHDVRLLKQLSTNALMHIMMLPNHKDQRHCLFTNRS